jgi:hypothetical protein
MTEKLVKQHKTKCNTRVKWCLVSVIIAPLVLCIVLPLKDMANVFWSALGGVGNNQGSLSGNAIKGMRKKGASWDSVAFVMRTAGVSWSGVATEMEIAGASWSNFATVMRNKRETWDSIAKCMREAHSSWEDIAFVMRKEGESWDDVILCVRKAGASWANITFGFHSTITTRAPAGLGGLKTLVLPGASWNEIVGGMRKAGASRDAIVSNTQRAGAPIGMVEAKLDILMAVEEDTVK